MCYAGFSGAVRHVEICLEFVPKVLPDGRKFAEEIYRGGVHPENEGGAPIEANRGSEEGFTVGKAVVKGSIGAFGGAVLGDIRSFRPHTKPSSTPYPSARIVSHCMSKWRKHDFRIAHSASPCHDGKIECLINL